jgi:membrane protease YdiL (CAAX protease family)
LFLFGLGQLLALVPGRFVFGFTQESLFAYPGILYFIAGSFAMVAVLQFLWIRYFERRTLASIGLGLSGQTARDFGLGFLYALAASISIITAIYFLGGYEIEVPVDLSLATFMPVLFLMGAFIIQSTTEEIVFRGWMMSRLIERYGLWVGVIGNSLLFTLMHLPSIEGDGALIAVIFALNVFLFSIFLSFYALKAKSVWGIGAWHAAWNWSYITWFGLPTTGIALDIKPLATDLMITEGAPLWLTGGLVGPENSIVVTIVLSVWSVWMYRRYRRSLTDQS